MEEATRQLELLKAIAEYPKLLKQNAEQEREINELQQRCQSLSSEIEELGQAKRIVGKERITPAQLKERIARIMAEQIKSQVEKQVEENKLAWEKTLEAKCTQRDLNLLSRLIDAYKNQPFAYFLVEEMESSTYKRICEMLEDFKNFVIGQNATNKHTMAEKPEEKGN